MKAGVTARDITHIAVASVLLLVVQIALRLLPNIELVSLLIILYTLHFRYKTLCIIYIFAVIEGVVYGFHLWWITYLYVWTILFLITLLFKDMRSPLFWAIIAAIYGISFGTLTSLPYFVVGGFSGGIAYIVRGVLFDLAHCVGNFVLVIALFNPLQCVFTRMLGEMDSLQPSALRH